MNKIFELLETIHFKELELRCLNYGAVEKRGNYLYTHYKLDGDNYTKYIGEYTEDAYNQAINDNIKAKKLKKDVRRLKREISSLGFETDVVVSEKVGTNIDYARRHVALTIYKQAILEGVETTELQTEDIVNGLKISNMTPRDVQTIVNLKHAWDFTLDRYVITTPSNYSILCLINKLVLEGFTYRAGKLRDVPVSIGGTDWVPDFPFEADIKDDIEKIVNKKKSAIDIAVELLLYVSRKQMFIDGNKRTAVIFANHYLISKGKGLIVVPDKKVDEYKKLLMNFYETNNSKEISEFLKKYCYTEL